MIDSTRYRCLGEILRDALIQFKPETAMIEVSRRRETRRLTYLQAKHAAVPQIRRLRERGVVSGSRVAMLMANQSRWLLGAYAALHRGAVRVPLDYKLTPGEQAALLAHCRPEVLFVDYGLWRRLPALDVPTVIVVEAPDGADLGTALRWEAVSPGDEPELVLRERDDVATIVYSSGTGGTPKGIAYSLSNIFVVRSALLTSHR